MESGGEGVRFFWLKSAQWETKAVGLWPQHKNLRLVFLLVIDDDRIANVVGNKARIASLSIAGGKPLFLRPSPYSDDV